MKLYTYRSCDTCRKAKRWLDARGIAYQEIAIRETPPSEAELRLVAASVGGVRKLFNTSGLDYRAMKLKDRLPKLSDADAIALLASNGNLVKRPLAVGRDFGIVGFRETDWKALFEV